jgi:hypothetical protein
VDSEIDWQHFYPRNSLTFGWHGLLLRRGTMKIKVIKAWILVAALFVAVVVVFVVFSTNERQLQTKRVSQNKYPCIVLKVDNNGCQTEIEMRTHVAVAVN